MSQSDRFFPHITGYLHHIDWFDIKNVRKNSDACIPVPLKGHGNEADFLEFLHKSVRHRFLTLNFEPFRYGLRIPEDIRNRKTTPRLAESGSRQECL
jgi:hypothetical protein